jgi:hypothetical protein
MILPEQQDLVRLPAAPTAPSRSAGEANGSAETRSISRISGALATIR